MPFSSITYGKPWSPRISLGNLKSVCDLFFTTTVGPVDLTPYCLP